MELFGSEQPSEDDDQQGDVRDEWFTCSGRLLRGRSYGRCASGSVGFASVHSDIRYDDRHAQTLLGRQDELIRERVNRQIYSDE